MRSIVLGLVLAMPFGCGGDEPRRTTSPDRPPKEKPPNENDTPVDTDVVDTDDDTPDGTPTGDTGPPPETADTAPDKEVPVVDCRLIPDKPIEVNQLDGPRGYHDLAFDRTGWIIGSDGLNLVRADYAGNASIFVPALSTLQGMAWLTQNELVVARDGPRTLEKITPGGGREVIATDVGAYGVRRGPDGMLYTANQQRIERIDPATGEKDVLFFQPGLWPRPLNFSPNWQRAYFGTISGDGSVYKLELDVDLTPVSDPVVVGHAGTGAYHDTMGVDACGNLYVADFTTNNLYRIDPSTGDSMLFFDFDFNNYGHGIEWGSGVGGWREDAVYMPQPYNGHQVIELVIGVPSREFDGKVIH